MIKILPESEYAWCETERVFFEKVTSKRIVKHLDEKGVEVEKEKEFEEIKYKKGVIDVDAHTLKQIGVTKKFNITENGTTIIDMTQSDFLLKKQNEYKSKNFARINYLKEWFSWYSNQVEQAQRAERTKTEWFALYNGKIYKTLSELDADANANQYEIRRLKNSSEAQ